MSLSRDAVDWTITEVASIIVTTQITILTSRNHIAFADFKYNRYYHHGFIYLYMYSYCYQQQLYCLFQLQVELAYFFIYNEVASNIVYTLITMLTSSNYFLSIYGAEVVYYFIYMYDIFQCIQ